MSNLWTPSTVEERKNVLKFKFSKNTLKKIVKNNAIEKDFSLDKKYSKKISPSTLSKVLF